MSPLDIILTSVAMSAFCGGVRTAMDEGNLLHFIRRPFTGWHREVERLREVRSVKEATCLATSDEVFAAQTLNEVKEITWRIRYLQTVRFLLKPVCLCVLCFASTWGTLAFAAVHGFAIMGTATGVLAWGVCVTIACLLNLGLLAAFSKHWDDA